VKVLVPLMSPSSSQRPLPSSSSPSTGSGVQSPSSPTQFSTSDSVEETCAQFLERVKKIVSEDRILRKGMRVKPSKKKNNIDTINNNENINNKTGIEDFCVLRDMKGGYLPSTVPIAAFLKNLKKKDNKWVLRLETEDEEED